MSDGSWVAEEVAHEVREEAEGGRDELQRERHLMRRMQGTIRLLVVEVDVWVEQRVPKLNRPSEVHE